MRQSATCHNLGWEHFQVGLLREDVVPRFDITQGKLAELLGVSRLTVSQLLHEHRALSPDMAMGLEKLTGTRAESWLHMQEAVDLWEARQQPERFKSIKRLPAATAARETTSIGCALAPR